MQFLSPISKRPLNPLPLFSHFQILLNFHTSPKPPHPPPQPLTPTDLTPHSVTDTLSTYANDWPRAWEFFNWVESDLAFAHTTTTCNRMIDVLGKFFEFDLAWCLIQKMKISKCTTIHPDHTTFRIVFKRYAAAHMVNEAIDTYNNRIEEFGFKDDTSFSNLIDALCDYKHVIEAEELCKNLGSGDTKLYNMMLRGWLKMGWWAKCREFWEKMEEKGVERDLHSYTIYMDIVCKSGKPWKAVKLYKEMKKKGVQLDVVAYNTAIHALGLSEGVDFSIGLFREMVELGCKPNIVTYNTIIKLLCQSGRLGSAYTILDQMAEKGCFPDVITYHCFFGSLNKPKEMLKLFDRMVESGIRPRMDTYVMLMTKFGRWGFLRPVLIVWNKMEELGCSPDAFAYNALINALIQKGMLDEARKYDEEMLARGLSGKLRKELAPKVLDVSDISCK